jgi:hypothetical protein
MSDNDERDEFSDWLTDSMVSTQGNPALRDSIINHCVRVLRWRRRAKRIGLAAALGGCYVAGMLTMLLQRAATALPIDLATTKTPAADVSSERSEHQSPVANQREHELASAKLTPYDRLRQLGDRQLSDETDIPGAIRTYRQALKVASDDQRALSVDHDSWLLMAIKTDQFQP